VLVSQLGFKQSVVDQIMTVLVDEVIITNEAIEEQATNTVNAAMASKLNCLLSVIFTSKDDTVLFELLDSSHKRQLADTVTAKFK